MHPSRAPCSRDFFVLGVVSIHARQSSALSCCNSHRANLSAAMMWFFSFFWFVFVLFLLGLVFFVVSALLFCLFSGGHRTWTTWTAYRSMLSFDTPKRERCKILHNSFNWHKHCVTTWREPRRRRTEKKRR